MLGSTSRNRRGVVAFTKDIWISAPESGTGPAPTTITDHPGRTLAPRTPHFSPVGRASDTATAARGSMVSGSVHILDLRPINVIPKHSASCLTMRCDFTSKKLARSARGHTGDQHPVADL
ncbi:uncharacterized protein N7459_006317 [Penicillium hispanicum]|uniref:uncharacterized protein n=1 Tax=Penicillium hispanicum TaxID=1080232 RepID=UPI0025405488|nr:uncharacterized protein N7459_006317 [Penicillium hispanicum]KAJ5580332.1 hypothetical protein N7459_006317 [Penicillium hispanicum]